MNDFIVIGGGIAGVSAAARLAKLGKVILLEREGQLAYHASGRSAALFEQSYGKPSTVALNRASRSYHETAGGGVLSPRGLMLVGAAHDDALFEADLADMEMAEITPAEAQEKVPVLNTAHVTRAGFHQEAWDIDTDKLIQHFAREVTRHGGQIVAQADVTKIDRTRLGWTVRTGKGEIYGASVLVNAAGAWADNVALMARIPPLGLTPLRRSMGRIPAPGDHDVSTWPMIFGVAESWYSKPDAGALIVSPGDEDPAEPHDAWPEDIVLAEGFARYEKFVTTPVTRLLSSWAGLRTFAPDRQLVLGPEPSDPAFVWCAGQGGYGFQTSPAASALVADLVAGREPALDPEIVGLLTPDRLR